MKDANMPLWKCKSHILQQKTDWWFKIRRRYIYQPYPHHLDYHKTVENYLKAKKHSLTVSSKTAFALTNLDDNQNGLVATQNTKAIYTPIRCAVWAIFKGKVLEDGFEGMPFDIIMEVNVQFIGRFN